jgi:CheY-like chemotaxis protein
MGRRRQMPNVRYRVFVRGPLPCSGLPRSGVHCIRTEMVARLTFSVLLVEDYPDDREMYADHLRGCGFSVIATEGGANALALADSCDVIVTDLRLRDSVDGCELIRRVRSDPRTAALPVIVVTAAGTDRERQRAIAAGCTLFLVKPCLPETLAAELRNILEGKADITSGT